MVYVAAQKLRERGPSGAALRQVAEDASAPRGSLQHYFPGGKDQLVAEALAWSGEFAADHVRAYVERSHPTPAGLLRHVTGWWADDLRDRGFTRGCPVAGTLLASGPDQGGVRTSAAAALSTWQRAIRDGLRATGVPTRRAGSLADLVLASLEGALVLARASTSVAPLHTVTRELGPLLDAAARERG